MSRPIPAWVLVLGLNAGLLASLRWAHGHGAAWALVAGMIYTAVMVATFKCGRRG